MNISNKKRQSRSSHLLLLVILIPVLFSSCVSLKKTQYFQDRLGILPNSYTQNKVEYIIKSGDELLIKILSSDKKTSQIFSSHEGNEVPTIFTVNDSGYIYIPYINEIHLQGLTIANARIKIQKTLTEYFNEISVTVVFAKYFITFLGEVNNPGTYTVKKDAVNIFEGLGIAGDLTDYANRKNIAIISTENNQFTIKYIDLTKKDLLNSPKIYLMPNDLIYAEPMKAKVFGIKSFPFNYVFQALTTIAILINVF